LEDARDAVITGLTKNGSNLFFGIAKDERKVGLVLTAISHRISFHY